MCAAEKTEVPVKADAGPIKWLEIELGSDNHILRKATGEETFVSAEVP